MNTFTDEQGKKRCVNCGDTACCATTLAVLADANDDAGLPARRPLSAATLNELRAFSKTLTRTPQAELEALLKKHSLPE